MANLKYYNSGTEEWETLVIGKQGPTGPQGVPGNDGALSPNAIINGAFEINQRGFTSTTTFGFGFDRWTGPFSGATGTYSSESFIAGSAPLAGYESKNFARLAVTTGNDLCRIQQLIESVRTFAGQTVTLSFFAKGTNPSGTGNLAAQFIQHFGTGGSPSSDVLISQQTFELTAGWTRYSLTFEIPSIAGKTFGTANNDYLGLWIGQGTSISTDAWTLDIWGVQLEAGAVATPFRRNAPSLQGELAACQRYYWRVQGSTAGYFELGQAVGRSTTSADQSYVLPVTMRVTPTSLDWGVNQFLATRYGAGNLTVTSVTLDTNSHRDRACTQLGVASGLTAGQRYMNFLNNNANAFIGFSAEL